MLTYKITVKRVIYMCLCCNDFSVCCISGSREYSEDSLKLACDYQATLDASFGGTEILEPLQAIYNKMPMTTHSRQVVVSTDL